MGFFTNLFTRSGVAEPKAADDLAFETTLRHSIAAMHEELARVLRAAAEAMSHHNRLEADDARARRQISDCLDRARAALESGDEALARRALLRKRDLDAQIDAIRPVIHDARSTRDRLKQQVDTMRSRLAEAERNAATLIARRNAARAQQKVALALAGIAESDNAFAALRDFQAAIAASTSVAAPPDERDTPAPGARPDADADVDDALAALKAERIKRQN